MKPLRAMKIHFKNEDQECKTGSVKRWVIVGGDDWKGSREEIWLMYFMYLYEIKTTKLLKLF
jgi:hypothetical protein